MPLSPEQVEVVREIALLKTTAETLSYTDALSSVQVTAMQAIVTTDWPALRYKVGHMVPNRKDILNSYIEQRRLVRHRVRLMLGLDPVSEEEIAMAELDGTYGAVIGGVGKGKGAGGGGGAAEFGIFSASTGTRGGGDNSEL
jgi:hypothetical protein